MAEGTRIGLPPKVEKDKPLYIGKGLGTPVYCNLEIAEGTYTDNNGRETTFEGIKEDTVLMQVSQQKNIIKTSIQGSDYGTVKEYIGMGDYIIDIALLITSGKQDVYPKEAVAKLKRLLDAPMPLKINSDYLNALGIFSIVIEQYSITQTMGSWSQATINIQACSDAPVILSIR